MMNASTVNDKSLHNSYMHALTYKTTMKVMNFALMEPFLSFTSK